MLISMPKLKVNYSNLLSNNKIKKQVIKLKNMGSTRLDMHIILNSLFKFLFPSKKYMTLKKKNLNSG
jgi:hypothetical protein